MGNTPLGAGDRRKHAVHPHACGEYLANWKALASPYGSSPRVWGILPHPSRGMRPWRFIPTRVGNTCIHQVGFWRLSVHPHACGEYIETPGHECRHPRFIPTRVGNTTSTANQAPFGAVHPHACGEYPILYGKIESVSRFIPTRVGNTLLPSR